MSKFSAYTWGMNNAKICHQHLDGKLDGVHNERGALESNLYRSQQKLRPLEDHISTLRNYAAGCKRRIYYTAPNELLEFARTGHSDTFDAQSILNPSRFCDVHHFPISVMPIISKHFSKSIYELIVMDFSYEGARLHNLNMAALIQSIIAYHKNPQDVANVSLRYFADKSIFTNSADEQMIFERSLSEWGSRMQSHSIKKIYGNRFSELRHLSTFSFAETPDDYLFQQKLAIAGFGDLQGNTIAKGNLKKYLSTCCPIKNNFEQFDFLRFLFIPKEIFDLPKSLIPIAAYHHFDSNKPDKHGVIDVIENDIKDTEHPLDFYQFSGGG